MKILTAILLIYFFTSCNDENGIITSVIEDDYSQIQDPKERWEAYKLSNYQIKQRRACECLGLEFTARVYNNSVRGVTYEAERNDEYTDFANRNAITVDQAFGLLEEYKSEAYSISVDYHPKYGYPTKLSIDIREMIADEEITYYMSDLKKIN